MLIEIKDKKDEYSAYNIVKAFYPDAQPQIKTGSDGFSLRELYLYLQKETGRTLPWGMLTGVRPVKLASKWLGENPKEQYEDYEAKKAAFVKWFYETRFVKPEKAELAFDIAMREQKLADTQWVKSFDKPYSLYVGIPFCQSICSYCSFSSGSISAYKDRVDEYVTALLLELEAIYEMQNGKLPLSIYIGGGTPTALSPGQIERVLDFVYKKFVMKCSVQEFTVEAGRPDSITEEKLKLLKKYGVNRISINPQTMQQKTLERIGRMHTTDDIIKKFELARELKFDNINMDLIMGLPGENLNDALNTLEKIKELNPDSLTVHSLAIKRSSKMGIQSKGAEKALEAGADIEKMLKAAAEAAKDMSMNPYYLYRQKNIAGNFENTGYAKENKECLYNVFVMEELQSIMAAGAGATSKLVLNEAVNNPNRRNAKKTNIIRCENVSDINEYITRIDEMTERKLKLMEIYK